MAARTKRTYNVPAGTIRQVRELADEYGIARSQDAVVALAVDRLYDEVRAAAEASRWADAADDPEFGAESSAIAAAYGDAETWPR